MRFFVVAIAAAGMALPLAIAPPAKAQSGQAFNMMGSASCAKWPKAATITSASKAVPLNWTLGFLSGWAAQSNLDLLDLVDPEAVSAWMDTYCQAHPAANLPTAARELERVLEERLPPPPPPEPPARIVLPPPAAPAAKAAQPARAAKARPARRKPAPRKAAPPKAAPPPPPPPPPPPRAPNASGGR